MTLDLSPGEPPHDLGGTEIRDVPQAVDLSTSFGSACTEYAW
jgi:hypothetical protein